MCVDLDNEEYDVGFVPVVPREKCQGKSAKGICLVILASDTVGLTQEICA